ncbi:low molecular weight protein-tyrosine-phosphatase [Membranihabitans marinus]|uniref:low molecular weight protein-tyrosine-phosphatase n=1 Tax=Membranihabitans marinus TaxID=1227546 RepID=UPI001F303C71|nr:low molecular weight protein-tyrosine-phosphatase [Membranihabitans marinus]
MKILMVCLGNICRSPLAEGILKDKLIKNNLNAEVDSAGTGAWHIGNPPDQRSIEIAHEQGIDISQQKARKIRSIDIDYYDLLLVMDEQNKKDVLKYCHTPSERQKVKKIMTYCDSNEDVPDPYYGEFGFKNVFKLLDQACEGVIDSIR